jgi:hypothetical protein
MKILFFLIFLSFSFVQAQDDTLPVPVGVSGEISVPSEIEEEEVFYEIIYPGCESFIEQGNEALKTCFHQKIRQEIHDVLVNYIGDIDDSSATEFHSKLKFIINIEGKIVDAEVNASDPEFRFIVQKTIHKIAERNTGIIPAKNKKGDSINSLFRVPVSLVFSD